MGRITSASQYHLHTSYIRHEIGGHYLDWQNQPDVYKNYPGQDYIPLQENSPIDSQNLFEILKKNEAHRSGRSINIDELSLILQLTDGITAKAVHSGQPFYYRSAASAGALYPIEIYTATSGMTGLEDGLYHFAVNRHSLYPLRKGNLTEYLQGIIRPEFSGAPKLVFFVTAIFFRSAWKYRDRAYRYHLLDGGHVMENLTLAIKSLGLTYNISYDFNDNGLNRLLGLDESKEVSLAAAWIPGHGPVCRTGTCNIPDLPEDIRNASVVSGNEIDYPVIREIHKACEVPASRNEKDISMPDSLGIMADMQENLPELTLQPSSMEYPECAVRRRSSRNFIRESVPKEFLLTILGTLCAEGTEKSQQDHYYRQSVYVRFITSNVEGLTPGLYMLDLIKRSFGPVGAVIPVESMAHACLDQAWLGNAAVHFLFFTNIERLDSAFGARGYRYAMMTAGRFGERIYITSSSLGIGCCGIGAFYDEEIAQLTGLNSESRLLYLVAAGSVKSLRGI